MVESKSMSTVDFLVTEKDSLVTQSSKLTTCSIGIKSTHLSAHACIHTYTNSDSSQVCYSHFHAITPQNPTLVISYHISAKHCSRK